MTQPSLTYFIGRLNVRKLAIVLLVASLTSQQTSAASPLRGVANETTNGNSDRHGGRQSTKPNVTPNRFLSMLLPDVSPIKQSILDPLSLFSDTSPLSAKSLLSTIDRVESSIVNSVQRLESSVADSVLHHKLSVVGPKSRPRGVTGRFTLNIWRTGRGRDKPAAGSSSRAASSVVQDVPVPRLGGQLSVKESHVGRDGVETTQKNIHAVPKHNGNNNGTDEKDKGGRNKETTSLGQSHQGGWQYRKGHRVNTTDLREKRQGFTHGEADLTAGESRVHSPGAEKGAEVRLSEEPVVASLSSATDKGRLLNKDKRPTDLKDDHQIPGSNQLGETDFAVKGRSKDQHLVYDLGHELDKQSRRASTPPEKHNSEVKVWAIDTDLRVNGRQKDVNIESQSSQSHEVYRSPEKIKARSNTDGYTLLGVSPSSVGDATTAKKLIKRSLGGNVHQDKMLPGHSGRKTSTTTSPVNSAEKDRVESEERESTVNSGGDYTPWKKTRQPEFYEIREDEDRDSTDEDDDDDGTVAFTFRRRRRRRDLALKLRRGTRSGGGGSQTYTAGHADRLLQMGQIQNDHHDTDDEHKRARRRRRRRHTDASPSSTDNRKLNNSSLLDDAAAVIIIKRKENLSHTGAHPASSQHRDTMANPKSNEHGHNGNTKSDAGHSGSRHAHPESQQGKSDTPGPRSKTSRHVPNVGHPGMERQTEEGKKDKEENGQAPETKNEDSSDPKVERITLPTFRRPPPRHRPTPPINLAWRRHQQAGRQGAAILCFMSIGVILFVVLVLALATSRNELNTPSGSDSSTALYVNYPHY